MCDGGGGGGGGGGDGDGDSGGDGDGGACIHLSHALQTFVNTYYILEY